MLISTGKVSANAPWRILEVAINQAPDVLALRISKQLKQIHEPAQVLIPFTPNASGVAEWVVEHVYVCGLNGSLARLAGTPGIDFTRKEHVSKDWIAQLLAIEQVSSSPQIGDFVRILSGPCARLCGEVASEKHDRFVVTVAMPTKTMRVHVSAHDLQVLHCPPDKKSFYFSQDLA